MQSTWTDRLSLRGVRQILSETLEPLATGGLLLALIFAPEIAALWSAAHKFRSHMDDA